MRGISVSTCGLIFGNFSEADIEEAVDEYCSMNYREVIKPYINKRDKSGNKVYTNELAITEAKRLLKQNYFS